MNNGDLAAPEGGPEARFEPGTQLTVREVWDGLLWAAQPVLAVSDDGDTLVHWSPTGTIKYSTTSRGVEGREHLSPSERQLVSLESRQWRYSEVPAPGTRLTFVRDGAWASVSLTWLPDGRFAWWYVNFQRPLERQPHGYDTLDLVVDMVVAPDGSWGWKDRDTFEAAIERGVFDRSIGQAVEEESARILKEIEAKSGPFDPRWVDWVAPSDWAPPELPPDFTDGQRTPPPLDH